MTEDEITKAYDIPSVPAVALKVIRLASDINTSVNDLQDAILADQGLATKVLHFANSPYYRVRHGIDTISEAIGLMGFDVIKNFVLALSTKDMYKRFGPVEQKLWEHGIGVSIASGILSKEIGFPNIEEAVVAGLLHDVGKIVMNNNQPETFMSLTQMVYNKRVLFYQIEREIFGFGHAELGGIFANKWGLPEDFADVIRRHHFVGLDELIDMELNKRILCSIVALADAICIRLGIGYRGPMTDVDIIGFKWKDILGITDARLHEITERFKEAYIQEKVFYQV